MFKGLFSWMFVAALLIAVMSSLTVVDGFPIKSQLAFIAQQTVQVMQDTWQSLGQALRDAVSGFGF